MRKEYRAALLEAFSAGLAHACPDFTLVKRHSALTGIPGERAYCWRISDNVFLWVVLIPDQKREAFFVEFGWSRKARFPQLPMRPSGVRPSEAASEEEYFCRLGELSGGDDMGWLFEELRVDATQEEMMAYVFAQTQPLSAELARARVAPRVEEALREFVQHGLSFLRKHAQPGVAGDAPQGACP
jgi:hypothetical protein